MGGGGREAVKVVIIDTEYVETDASSFKSVVQKLTGQDSTAAETGFSRKLVDREKRPGSDHVTNTRSDPVLMRDLSFKEFERLLKEIPAVDELQRLWADN